jgi:hypothetical protein
LPPSRRRAVPTTVGEQALLRTLAAHELDTGNPHAVAMRQLTDVTNWLTAVTGTVPMKQADGSIAFVIPPGAAGGSPVGTATPLPNSGTGSNGGDPNPASQNHYHPAGRIGVTDHGGVAWTDDPKFFTATSTFSAGTIFGFLMEMAVSAPIVGLTLPRSAGGTGLTDGRSAAYGLDGTRLGITGNVSGAWGSAGASRDDFTAPTAVLPAGTLFIAAFLAVGTTAPSLYAGIGAPRFNQGRSAAQGLRGASYGVGQTALPASLTLSSGTATSTPRFIVAE